MTSDHVMAQLKDEIRRLREQKEWSQVKLAGKAGVSPSSVYRLEAGKAPKDGDATEKVLHALGLDLGHFLSPRASTAHELGQNLPSNMGQMIGRLQLPAGVEDYFTVVQKIALDYNAPAEVFKDLAAARDEAPPSASFDWWMRRYLDSVARTTSQK